LPWETGYRWARELVSLWAAWQAYPSALGAAYRWVWGLVYWSGSVCWSALASSSAGLGSACSWVVSGLEWM